jgi:hypothetical protein
VEAERQVMKIKHLTEIHTYFHFGMRTAYKFLLFDTDSPVLNTLQIQRSLTLSDKLVLIKSVPTPHRISVSLQAALTVFLWSACSLEDI